MSKRPLAFAPFIILMFALTMPVTAQTQDISGAKKITKEELDTRLAFARSLAQEKKYEEALKEYLFVFDNSREVTGYGGVRLSYVPSEIAAIGTTYRPARVALQVRRDEREKLVLAAKGDFDILHELTSLSEYLNEPERNIALLDKLKPMGVVYADVRNDLVTLIWEQLVALKRYDDLKDKIDEMARGVASHIAESAVIKDFPDQTALTSPEYQQFLSSRIAQEGGNVYETLLALGRTEKANKLAKWMLTFSSDGAMYAYLIHSALDANRSEVAADLVEQAKKTLKREEDLRIVREAAQRIPKAK